MRAVFRVFEFYLGFYVAFSLIALAAGGFAVRVDVYRFSLVRIGIVIAGLVYDGVVFVGGNRYFAICARLIRTFRVADGFESQC